MAGFTVVYDACVFYPAPLRDLLLASAELASRRGTVGGIVRFLEIATRHTGFVVQDAGEFHLRVQLPAGADHLLEVARQIVSATKPAHVTAEVVVAPTDTEQGGSR